MLHGCSSSRSAAFRSAQRSVARRSFATCGRELKQRDTENEIDQRLHEPLVGIQPRWVA
jgi:hypothetical protein